MERDALTLLRRMAARLRRQAISRSGPVARFVLHPNPFARLARRPIIDIARDAGIGDVVLCTPGLRALKAAHPRSRIRFYTRFPELVRGLPYIDEVHPYTERPPEAAFVEYTDIVPSPAHIARLLGDRMGVVVIDTQPDCQVDAELVTGCRAAWAHLPRPWVVVLRRASRFTPNKDWPFLSWKALVATLCGFGSVIEIGDRDDLTPVPAQNYLDLRGDTSLEQLVAIMAAADIHVGPVSGPVHIAAALHTPSVTIIGGYEHPDNTHYPGNVAFYTALPCAPCWKREPCPYDTKCLRAITPQSVAAAVRNVWQQKPNK